MKLKTQKRFLPSCQNETFWEEFLSKKIPFGTWTVTVMSKTFEDFMITKRDFQRFK